MTTDIIKVYEAVLLAKQYESDPAQRRRSPPWRI